MAQISDVTFKRVDLVLLYEQLDRLKKLRNMDELPNSWGQVQGSYVDALDGVINMIEMHRKVREAERLIRLNETNHLPVNRRY